MRTSVLALLAVTLFAPKAFGHGGAHNPPPPAGGTWRGPGDLVPPGGSPTTPAPGGPGPSRPATPVPSGPSTPAPARPATPGPGPAGRPTVASSPTTPSSIGMDPADWSRWWELNRHAYLQLRPKIWAPGTETGADDFFLGHGDRDARPGSLRLTLEQVSTVAVPALARTLEREDHQSIVSGCLMGLAKAGPAACGAAQVDALSLIRARLSSGNQQISETAALALGIYADPAVLGSLAALVADDERGHRLVGKRTVPNRTRAFAAYALALLGQRSNREDHRRFVVHELVRALENDDTGSHDLAVACVNGLSLIQLPRAEQDLVGDDPPSSSHQALVAYLVDQLRARRGLEMAVRAHVPRALGKLVDPADEELKAPVVAALLERLEDRRSVREVVYGCILGLGCLGRATDSATDVAVRAALFEQVRDGDELGRRLSLISLAKVAARPGDGEDATAARGPIREYLLRQLARGKSRLRPWAALALGIHGFHGREAGLEQSDDVSTALRGAMTECRSPESIGAYALACGLRRDPAAYETLVRKLELFQDDAARGYVALLLGLLGERVAIEPLRKMLYDSKWRPERMRRAGTALALLHERGMVPVLCDRIMSSTSKALIAIDGWTLAHCADVRALNTAVHMMERDVLGSFARGIATLVVGFIVEPTDAPWNTELAVDANYAASPPTHYDTEGGAVLNIR